jgi:hypothetical protein
VSNMGSSSKGVLSEDQKGPPTVAGNRPLLTRIGYFSGKVFVRDADERNPLPRVLFKES